MPKGGEKMNKKVIVLVASVMTLAMLTTPVLAIGPQKAEDNPNVGFPGYGGVSLNSPSGFSSLQQNLETGLLSFLAPNLAVTLGTGFTCGHKNTILREFTTERFWWANNRKQCRQQHSLPFIS
jgi:hypothetical protein